MNTSPKAKAEQVPTLTPHTLGGLVFKSVARQSKQGPYFNTFHINRIEEVRQLMKFPMPPHRKTIIDFILITQGSMIRQKGLTRYEVGVNTFFFLPAHQICCDHWMSDDIQGYYCHFDPILLTKGGQKQDRNYQFPFLEFLGNPLVSLSNELLAQIMPLINRLYTEYEEKRSDSVEIFSTYLFTLFTELKRATPLGEHTATDPGSSAVLRFTQRYKNALSQCIYEKQTVADYAELFHISPNHLNKCVKTATGQSARDLLDEMILLEAKVLLAQTDLSVSEIAYRIGKQDRSNFSRFFRTKTGMSPKAYRRLD